MGQQSSKRGLSVGPASVIVSQHFDLLGVDRSSQMVHHFCWQAALPAW